MQPDLQTPCRCGRPLLATAAMQGVGSARSTLLLKCKELAGACCQPYHELGLRMQPDLQTPVDAQLKCKELAGACCQPCHELGLRMQPDLQALVVAGGPCYLLLQCKELAQRVPPCCLNARSWLARAASLATS